mmetsp:Transcript_10827/g.19594  ORF Transcript_10827/g.19594 Transcript_10827/m.19594 type:complete len:208 (-) Transcript_10827:212-835(-)
MLPFFFRAQPDFAETAFPKSSNLFSSSSSFTLIRSTYSCPMPSSCSTYSDLSFRRTTSIRSHPQVSLIFLPSSSSILFRTFNAPALFFGSLTETFTSSESNPLYLLLKCVSRTSFAPTLLPNSAAILGTLCPLDLAVLSFSCESPKVASCSTRSDPLANDIISLLAKVQSPMKVTFLPLPASRITSSSFTSLVPSSLLTVKPNFKQS